MVKKISIQDFNLLIESEKLNNVIITPLNNNCFLIKGFYKEVSFRASVIKSKNFYNVNINGLSYSFELVSAPSEFSEQNNGEDSKIFAPMNGFVKEVLVKENEEVQLVFLPEENSRDHVNWMRHYFDKKNSQAEEKAA